MLFRAASTDDIPGIQFVRRAVRENRLSNPDLVTDQDCETYLSQRGKGWVCVVDQTVVGFSIVDLVDHNVWALFVLPEFEGQGIGKKLQQLMLDWYFSQTTETLWLGTEPKSRAAEFYRRNGWTQTGAQPNGELRFEMQAP